MIPILFYNLKCTEEVTTDTGAVEKRKMTLISIWSSISKYPHIFITKKEIVNRTLIDDIDRHPRTVGSFRAEPIVALEVLQVAE
jgi:hypothetical protein